MSIKKYISPSPRALAHSEVVLQIVSGTEKNAFDQAGPVWLPPANAKDGRSGDLRGLCLLS